MAVAELSNDRIVLTTEFREKEMVKTVPGVRWSSEEQVWWLPLSWAGCVQLRGVFGAELAIGQALNAWAAEQLRTRINPCLALRVAADAPELAILSALRPYQRAGAAFLVAARQALIADEMGTGKTVQTISALEVIGDAAYPALIVCPSSMKLTWEAEFHKWAPSRMPVVIAGTAAKRRSKIEELQLGAAQVGIINYEALRYHTRLDGYGSVTLSDDDRTPKELNQVPFKSVVADEAHRVKDPRAKQTRALWAIGRPAQQRYALTGTPVANTPEDIWTLMRFVSPEEYPAKTKFIERYALQAYNVFGFMQVVGVKAETREELFKILDPRMIRRLKKAVLPQLPDKTYVTRTVELEAKQRKAYDMLRKEMMAELTGGTLMATNTLTQCTRLVQFASAYGELVDQGRTDAEGQTLLDLILTDPSCKVDALMEVIEELGEQQAVVFAESRQLIELAAKRLAGKDGDGVRFGQITGSVSPLDRQEAVTAFQSHRLKLLLCTLGAGGEGLTLTAAATAIFLQRSFSMVKNVQAEDRIHRIGQEADAVTIVDLVAANTIEARIHAVRAEKGERLEEIVRDADTLKVWLSR